eukprot:TRINITY_DN3897_c0_g2_i2.p1 TRINITY_DN3897_c0_g2~~TRINITY_DN3897_c0_g2_i2.p1  ORF type:complete len:105 (-),score=7.71 TRINITY_DN3897_c0_g2_i2:250-564(-)
MCIRDRHVPGGVVLSVVAACCAAGWLLAEPLRRKPTTLISKSRALIRQSVGGSLSVRGWALVGAWVVSMWYGWRITEGWGMFGVMTLAFTICAGVWAQVLKNST